jgi:CHASE1-domain containing sensor protein
MHVLREDKMQAAIDRVMQAFTLMANLTPEEAEATRERLAEYLAGMDADEKALAVEGLRYLRGPGRVARRRMAREATSRII